MKEVRTIEIIEKPWGEEWIWAKTDKYAAKTLCIKARQRLSLQYHVVKDETVTLLEGQVILQLNGDRGGYQNIKMHKGYIYRIYPGTVHRLTAIVDSKVLEASTSELDDVVRLEDDYRRFNNVGLG